MILFGKFSTAQVIKILGIVQCILAILATSMGIAMSVKFHKVKQEANTPYERAIDYIDNPWTTKYGAGIWIGLVLLLAGIFGSSADIKPEKSKYTYACLAFNILGVIFSIVLLPFLFNALNWYEDCKYTYLKSKTETGIRDCSSHDKNMGNDFYIVLILALVLVLPVTIAMITLIIIANMVLFDGICDGGCYRQLIYKIKGGNNATVKVKTKNTHEFDQVYMGQISSPTFSSNQERSEKNDYNLKINNSEFAPPEYSSSMYL